MDRDASCNPSGCVGQVAVDLLSRICGAGSRRSTRSCGSGEQSGPEGYCRLQDKDSHEIIPCYDSLAPIENSNGSSEYDEEEEEMEVRPWTGSSYWLQQRHRSSFSSNESSKRWMLTDQYNSRRRKGFYCMRLRIANVARLVALMRKVRLAYRRMMNAAAASKTILSLSDLYNDLADLIPVPCSSSEARTIVIIRPIKCVPEPAADLPDELPAVETWHGSSSTSATSEYYTPLRQAAGHDKSISRTVEGQNYSSSWPKLAFPSFSRAYRMSSCTPSLSTKECP